MNTLLWDFDGTLGYREGGWPGALIEVLDRQAPGHSWTEADVRPHLQAGFPWHSPQQTHPHLTTGDAWWTDLSPVFQRAYQALGVEAHAADELASQVCAAYCDLARWRLYDDVLPALTALSDRNWRHVIVSNHVPELRGIVEHLGLRPWVGAVFNSAESGYEKPHPEAFRPALRAAAGAGVVCLIGDSMEADVLGAAAVGIPAILVRRPHSGAEWFCSDLGQVLDLLLNMGPMASQQ